MNNFLFSLNAVMPVFLTMLAGVLFRRLGLVSKNFASMLNSFVFKIALPLLLFQDLSQVDILKVWDTTYVLYCFLVTLCAILVIIGLSFLVAPKNVRGEFVQASYRSSAAIIGLAFIQNIYGSSEMGALMIVASVPLYNVAAVLVLTMLSPEDKGDTRAAVQKALKGIITNPIILGILAGILWSLSGVKQPVIMQRTVKNFAQTATPLGLLALGAEIEWGKVKDCKNLAFLATGIKLVGLCAVFLPIAVAFGFRDQKLVAILVMLGSATTVSSYVMARNMGYDGSLTSASVLLTTFLSSVTLTFWLWLFRTLALI